MMVFRGGFLAADATIYDIYRTPNVSTSLNDWLCLSCYNAYCSIIRAMYNEENETDEMLVKVIKTWESSHTVALKHIMPANSQQHYLHLYCLWQSTCYCRRPYFFSRYAMLSLKPMVSIAQKTSNQFSQPWR